MNLSKGGQEPNVCIMPEMSVESKVEQPESKTYRCRQRSELRLRNVFNLAEDVCIKSTTCVSSFSNTQGQLTGLTPLTNVGFSPIQGVNPLESRSQFTSTSISSLTMLDKSSHLGFEISGVIVRKFRARQFQKMEL